MTDVALLIVTRTTAYDDLPEWLTPEEAWTYLRLSRAQMYDLIRKKGIASKKFGPRLIRIPKAAVAPQEIAK